MNKDTYTIKPFEWVQDTVDSNRYYMVNTDYYVVSVGPKADPIRFDMYEYQENGDYIYIDSKVTLEEAKASVEGYMRNKLLSFLEPAQEPARALAAALKTLDERASALERASLRAMGRQGDLDRLPLDPP